MDTLSISRVTPHHPFPEFEGMAGPSVVGVSRRPPRSPLRLSRQLGVFFQKGLGLPIRVHLFPAHKHPQGRTPTLRPAGYRLESPPKF